MLGMTAGLLMLLARPALAQSAPLPIPQGAVARFKYVEKPRVGSRSPVREKALSARFSKLPLAGQWSAGTFVQHRAHSVASLGKDWMLVVANTGVWLHEARTMARRVQLISPPVDEVATSPDGGLIAYTQPSGRLAVLTFPALKQIFTTNVDRAHRVRFSSDGKHLALASRAEDSATWIDLQTKNTRRLSAGDDVNDAVMISDHPGWIAFADDGDELEIYDFLKRRKVASTRSMIRGRYRGVPFFKRDQDAIAYDPRSKILAGGGGDNLLWKFSIKGSPRYTGTRELNDNITEIALLGRDRWAVATDSGTVYAVRNRRVQGRLGPLSKNLHWKLRARVDTSAKGVVFAVLGGYVLSWRPGQSKALLAPGYRPRGRMLLDEGTEDTAALYCARARCTLHLFAPQEDREHIESTKVSSPRLDSAHFLRAPGARWIVDHPGRLRLHRWTGRGLKATRTRLPANGAIAISKDGAKFGYAVGKVLYEADAKTLKFRAIAKFKTRAIKLDWSPTDNEGEGGWWARDHEGLTLEHRSVR